MKSFVVYYYQRTKRGTKEKTMKVEAVSRSTAFYLASKMLPRHSWIGNVYTEGGKYHKMVLAGLL